MSALKRKIVVLAEEFLKDVFVAFAKEPLNTMWGEELDLQSQIFFDTLKKSDDAKGQRHDQAPTVGVVSRAVRPSRRLKRIRRLEKELHAAKQVPKKRSARALGRRRGLVRPKKKRTTKLRASEKRALRQLRVPAKKKRQGTKRRLAWLAARRAKSNKSKKNPSGLTHTQRGRVPPTKIKKKR